MPLNCTTININGLRDYSKREMFQTMIQNRDIVFIQETHFVNIKEARKFTYKWEGEGFWSFGTERSKGVGIFVNKKLNYKVNHFITDIDGRYVALDIRIDNIMFRLVCVYAPNTEAHRKVFLDDLSCLLITNNVIIMAGDYNCVENISLDKVGGNPLTGNIGHKQIEELKTTFKILDPFRFKHELIKEYSFYHSSQPIQARLDRFYITDTLGCEIDTIQHVPCPLSDHSFVTLKLNPPNSKTTQGPGYWKCNVKVLYNPDFKLAIEDLWETLKTHHPKDDVWWENCKIKFKELIITHSKKTIKTHCFLTHPYEFLGQIYPYFNPSRLRLQTYKSSNKRC